LRSVATVALPHRGKEEANEIGDEDLPEEAPAPAPLALGPAEEVGDEDLPPFNPVDQNTLAFPAVPDLDSFPADECEDESPESYMEEPSAAKQLLAGLEDLPALECVEELVVILVDDTDMDMILAPKLVQDLLEMDEDVEEEDMTMAPVDHAPVKPPPEPELQETEVEDEDNFSRPEPVEPIAPQPSVIIDGGPVEDEYDFEPAPRPAPVAVAQEPVDEEAFEVDEDPSCVHHHERVDAKPAMKRVPSDDSIEDEIEEDFD
ncbi:hypothetical protein CYMTET_23733, partial [Cymbomonas tetramitiformis]